MDPDYLLQHQIRSCLQCPLGPIRDADGALGAPAEVGTIYTRGGLALMAEAPGKDEAKLGRPFVGKAGKLLDSMCREAGIDRSEVVLLNRVRCRPPGNRLQDHPEALLACDPWLLAELEAYDPRVVVLMGKTAMSLMFGVNPAVGQLAGYMRVTVPDSPYGGRIWVATYHPAAVLRTPGLRGIVVRDLAAAADETLPF